MHNLFLLHLTTLLLTLLPGYSSVFPHARPPALRKVADVSLPGGTTRFDYQSFDPQTGRLYLSHMGDGHLVVFDTKTNRVVANLPGFPSVTGVLFVPELKRVYASAAGSHEVVAVDAGSLKILARISGAQFPDGLAYAPDEGKVFVSDESGGADLVIDAYTNKRLARIPLGGEAGNTHYDPMSHRIFVAVQTRNEMAAIDPKTDRIVARYALPGSDFPHGFTIDSPHRLMFVSCEGNAKLLVVDMRSMKVTATFSVGKDPDVLAFDPSLKRLYVSSESGTVSVFEEKGAALVPLGNIFAPNAHTVSVDSRTHRVYLPLKNVGGRPVLRILEPSQ
ncbi:MAG TPA: YncE family protein [Chthonomonadaceae bacterium]|nr:YncE family protein [Chthonomonadaceae bacterium]